MVHGPVTDWPSLRGRFGVPHCEMSRMDRVPRDDCPERQACGQRVATHQQRGESCRPVRRRDHGGRATTGCAERGAP